MRGQNERQAGMTIEGSGGQGEESGQEREWQRLTGTVVYLFLYSRL